MQHNNTKKKAEMLTKGDKYAFINPEEWKEYNLWCIENLNKMIEKENENEA
jgi:hypothetical protein